MKLLINALTLCALAAPSWASAQMSIIYDLDSEFVNPVKDIPEGCSACIDVFRVNRMVAPLVYHVFVGVDVQWSCADSAEQSSEAFVYGGVKGESDRSRFEKYVSSPEQYASRLEYVGSACDVSASEALDIAVKVSERRRREFRENPVYAVARFVATPVMGRPCAEGAAEVIEAMTPLLTE